MASITINTSDEMVNEINRIAEVENRNVSNVALNFLANGMGENGINMLRRFNDEKAAAKAAREAKREAAKVAKENEKREKAEVDDMLKGMSINDIKAMLALRNRNGAKVVV
jgi:predicted transcriptional regulator